MSTFRVWGRGLVSRVFALYLLGLRSAGVSPGSSMSSPPLLEPEPEAKILRRNRCKYSSQKLLDD